MQLVEHRKVCGVCGKPGVIRSRCFRHYVRDLARQRDLLKNKWMKANFDHLVFILYGRYIAVKIGDPDALPVEQFLRAIPFKQPAPHWASPNDPRFASRKGLTNHGGRLTFHKMSTLVSVIDARARRDRDEIDSRSAQDRG